MRATKGLASRPWALRGLAPTGKPGCPPGPSVLRPFSDSRGQSGDPTSSVKPQVKDASFASPSRGRSTVYPFVNR